MPRIVFLLIALFFLFFPVNAANAQWFEFYDTECEEYYLEQEVECISVCHLDGGSSIIFFWDLVQGEFTLLHHEYWWKEDNRICNENGETIVYITVTDYPTKTHYKIKTKCYVESYEKVNPLNANGQKQWFQQMLSPGLKQPKRNKTDKP